MQDDKMQTNVLSELFRLICWWYGITDITHQPSETRREKHSQRRHTQRTGGCCCWRLTSRRFKRKTITMPEVPDQIKQTATVTLIANFATLQVFISFCLYRVSSFTHLAIGILLLKLARNWLKSLLLVLLLTVTQASARKMCCTLL